MYTLGISNFPIPGESGFPLNAMYTKPANRAEDGKQPGCLVHLLLMESTNAWVSSSLPVEGGWSLSMTGCLVHFLLTRDGAYQSNVGAPIHQVDKSLHSAPC